MQDNSTWRPEKGKDYITAQEAHQYTYTTKGNKNIKEERQGQDPDPRHLE